MLSDNTPSVCNATIVRKTPDPTLIFCVTQTGWRAENPVYLLYYYQCYTSTSAVLLPTSRQLRYMLFLAEKPTAQ